MSYLGKNTNRISTANSTSTLLAAGATFTGTAEDVSAYDTITIGGSTDQAGTISVQFSTNGTNWDDQVPYSFRSTSYYGIYHRFTVTKQYYRIVITNTSASPQTYLRFQSIYNAGTAINSAGNSVLQLEADTIAVRTLDPALEVARGLREGIAFVNKFGRNPDTVTGDAIWVVSTAYRTSDSRIV